MTLRPLRRSSRSVVQSVWCRSARLRDADPPPAWILVRGSARVPASNVRSRSAFSRSPRQGRTVVALVALDGKLNIRAVVGVVLLATAAIRLLPGIRAALTPPCCGLPNRRRCHPLEPNEADPLPSSSAPSTASWSDPNRDTPCDDVRFQLELENPDFLAPRRGRDVHGARSPCLRRDAGDALPVEPDGSHRQLRNGSDDFVMSPSLRSSGRADDVVSGT